MKRPVRYEKFAPSASASLFIMHKLGKSADVQEDFKFIIAWILKTIDAERCEKSYGSLEFMKY